MENTTPSSSSLDGESEPPRDNADDVREPRARAMRGILSLALVGIVVLAGSWHATNQTAAMHLVPDGALWAVAFEGPSVGSDTVAVARFPGTDPGTGAARERAAAALARAGGVPFSPPGVGHVHSVTATYPAYSYSAELFLQDVSSPSPFGNDWLSGYVVFTPHGRYVIACQSISSEADVDARCGYVLTSFRETGPGLTRGAPSIAGVVTAVYGAWKHGDPSAADSFATPRVVRDLEDEHWVPGYGGPVLCASGDSDFACTLPKHGQPSFEFDVGLVNGRWKVVADGDCSGSWARFDCYVVRSAAVG